MNRIWLACASVAIFALLLPAKDKAAQTEQIQKLIAIIGSEDSPKVDETKNLILEAGPQAVRAVGRLIWDKRDASRENAAGILAIIGGDDAIKILREVSQGDIRFRPSFYSAIAQRGKKEDLELLKTAVFPFMDQPHLDIRGTIALIHAAFRRYSEIPFVENLVAEGDYDATLALNWIKTNPRTVSMPVKFSDRDLIAVVLSHGLPLIEKATTYYDNHRNGVWRCGPNELTFTYSDSRQQYPNLSIEAHVSGDGSRALASVWLGFGSLNGRGYDFWLKRTNGKWILSAFWPTGIA
jgi:hypothetical protein